MIQPFLDRDHDALTFAFGKCSENPQEVNSGQDQDLKLKGGTPRVIIVQERVQLRQIPKAPRKICKQQLK